MDSNEAVDGPVAMDTPETVSTMLTETPDGNTEERMQVEAAALPGASGPLDDCAYITQFLSFAPHLFANGIYNAMKGYTWDCLHAIHRYIREEFEGKVSEEELIHGQNKVETAMNNKIDAVIDKLEMYLKDNIFHLPANVVLPEDDIQEKQPCTTEEEAKLDEEISDLKRQILCAKYASARYKEAIEDMETTQKEMSQLIQSLKALQKIQRAGGVENLAEYAKFMTTNLLQLFSVVESLKAQELPQEGHGENGEPGVAEIMEEFRGRRNISEQQIDQDTSLEQFDDVAAALQTTPDNQISEVVHTELEKNPD